MAFHIGKPEPKISPVRQTAGIANAALEGAVNMPGNMLQAFINKGRVLDEQSEASQQRIRDIAGIPYNQIPEAPSKPVPNLYEAIGPSNILQTITDRSRDLGSKSEESQKRILDKAGLKYRPDIEYPAKPIPNILPDKYLEPKNAVEQSLQSVARDVGALSVPIGGSLSFPKILKAAGLGNLAHFVSKDIVGLPENISQAVKAVTMAGATALPFESLKKIKEDAYFYRDMSYGKTEKVGAKHLEDTLNSIDEQISNTGIPTKLKNELKTTVRDLGSKITYLDKEPHILVEDVVETLRNINETFGGHRPEGVASRVWEIRDSLNHLLNTYGKKNPEFLHHHKLGNEIHSFTNEGLKIKEELLKGLKIKDLVGGASFGLLLGPWIGFPKAIATGAGLQAGFTAAKNIKNIMNKNPMVSKYYVDTIVAAAKKNTPVMLNSIGRLENALNKEKERRKKAGSFHIA